MTLLSGATRYINLTAAPSHPAVTSIVSEGTEGHESTLMHHGVRNSQ